MSEPLDIDSRPTKRLRLDGDASSVAVEPTTTSHTLAQASTTASSKAPIASSMTPVDADLEREIRAGITEYVCPGNLGFTGILKQRYTDFIVNEIGLDGIVLHLQKVDTGRKESNGEERSRKKQENGDIEKQDAAVAVELSVAGSETAPENGEAVTEMTAQEQRQDAHDETLKLAEEDLSALHSIFGESTTTQILSLVRSIRRHENKKAKDFKAVIAPPIKDKETRTQAHQSLRRIFPGILESSMEADQSIRIKAVPPQERKGKGKGKGANRKDRDRDSDRRRGQLGWEELGGEYLHFTLYKENKDTMEIVGFLGSKLNSGSKAFSFAGTKDRRACTVQRICVKRQTIERMNALNQILFNAAIGDYAYRDRDLSLGDLMGNEFTITLRDCHFQGEEGLSLPERFQLGNKLVKKAVEDFSEKGFINYYGLQRFGTFSSSTDTVGLRMLQGDLKGAVDDLLAYSDVALAAALGSNGDPAILVSQDDKNRAKALHQWKTTGKGALDILPKKFSAERNIIQHLSSRNSKTGKHDRKTDWQGALMCIPRNLRLMYVHAYQSLVWNTVAGKRWTMYGDKVMEGDLVLVHEHKDKELGVQETVTDTLDQDGEVIINPSGAESAFKHEDVFERARALSKEEAESGRYSIYDVVLPQPGFDVEYPKNAIGRFYEEFMGSERGGGLDPHNMRRSWRDVSLSGGYRKFLARPLKPLEFEIREYVKSEEQFVETDLQKIQREKGTAAMPEKKQEHERAADTKDVEMADESAKKLAVVLKLQLGSSQYATVALRELMKAGGVKAYKPEYMGGR